MLLDIGAASSAYVVTPSDTVVQLANRGFMVSGAGDVKVTTIDGQTVSFTGLTAGTFVPLQVKLVWATGSTGSVILFN